MAVHPLAGQPAVPEMLIDTEKLVADYFSRKPDLSKKSQLVSFGTSGHRGTSQDGTFTESHILAVTQALVEYRSEKEITGPIRTRFPIPPNDRHWKFWPLMALKRGSKTETDLLPRQRFPMPSSATIAAERAILRMGLSSLPLITRRKMVGSNTIPPTVVPQTPISPAGCRTAPMTF